MIIVFFLYIFFFCEDYKPPSFIIPQIQLDFNIKDDETIVNSKMLVLKNPSVFEHDALVLNSSSHSTLQELRVDGGTMSEKKDYHFM